MIRILDDTPNSFAFCIKLQDIVELVGVLVADLAEDGVCLQDVVIGAVGVRTVDAVLSGVAAARDAMVPWAEPLFSRRVSCSTQDM